MAGKTPVQTVNDLITAINDGDLNAASAWYEPNATMVVEPGALASGMAATRTGLEGFIALRPALRSTAHQVIETGDLALFCSKWALTGTGLGGQPVHMGGTSSDILRRQADAR